MKKFILSIDQGTTGTTALLIDSDSLSLVAKHNIEFKQIFPKPGWVEHDLNDIWATVKRSTEAVIQENNLNKEQIECIGITNQRETTCAYDKSGTPLHNAIVWQDRRTANYCDARRFDYGSYQNKTGLPLDPYFSGTKMAWLLENSNQVKTAASDNNLRLSTIDTFLLYKLSGHTSFKTEGSNASRTLLMDLQSCAWDEKLLSFFNIKKEYLPSIEDSFNMFGTTNGLDFLPDGIPISCILGDQQAALFGQAGYKAGDLKCTYGTGAFILLNTGNEIFKSRNGLLTTVAYLDKGKPVYALEGSTYIAGAAVQWLRDNLKIIQNASEIEDLAKEVTNLEEMEHLLFMPFFTGIGSPYWNAEAKAAILGLTRDTGNAHIARACLEGIALSVNDSIQALAADSPIEIKEIKVDGGACANNFLMQIQASFSKKEIVRPSIIETTAYGVALGALVGLDRLSFADIDKLWEEEQRFSAEESSYYPKKLEQWSKTIKKVYL